MAFFAFAIRAATFRFSSGESSRSLNVSKYDPGTYFHLGSVYSSPMLKIFGFPTKSSRSPLKTAASIGDRTNKPPFDDSAI